MDMQEVRKSLLQSFIGFLILTALIAIVTVIRGEVGDTEARILGTTFTISVASVCAMSCAAFLEKRNFKVAGITGMVLSLLSAILIITEIWATIAGDLYYKFTIAVVVGAFSFAHSLLLFLPDLSKSKQWIQRAAAVTIGVLAVQIIAGIWFEIDDPFYFRVMTVIAILVGLETLVIPILMKLENKNDEERERLILTKVDEKLYEDQSGKRYEVRKKSM